MNATTDRDPTYAASQANLSSTNYLGTPTLQPPHNASGGDVRVTGLQSEPFSMDTLDLGPPIATLRSLGALSKGGPSTESFRDRPILQAPTDRGGSYRFCDPVSRGVLSDIEADRALNMYF